MTLVAEMLFGYKGSKNYQNCREINGCKGYTLAYFILFSHI